MGARKDAPKEEPGLPPLGTPLTAFDLVGLRVDPASMPPRAIESAVGHALVERYVESLRVGRVDRDAHEARLRVTDPRGGEAIEVRLRHEDGSVRATLDGDDRARTRSLARRVQDELELAGIATVAVTVEP